jgi:hypothetical protein
MPIKAKERSPTSAVGSDQSESLLSKRPVDPESAQLVKLQFRFSSRSRFSRCSAGQGSFKIRCMESREFDKEKG